MLARSAFAPRHKNAGRPAHKSAPGFLKWLRGRNCLCVDRGGCAGRMEAAHVDHAGDKGMSTKVSDCFAVPLCSEHHRVQHQHGWPAFEANFRIDAIEASRGYWAAWPGRRAWEVDHAR